MKATNTYQIYFPSVSPENTKPEIFQFAKDTAIETLSESFGGLSVSEKSGYWKDSKSGKIVKEDVTVFELSDFSDNPDEQRKRLETVKAVTVGTLTVLQQDCVFVKVNGNDHLIFESKDFPTFK